MLIISPLEHFFKYFPGLSFQYNIMYIMCVKMSR